MSNYKFKAGDKAILVKPEGVPTSHEENDSDKYPCWWSPADMDAFVGKTVTVNGLSFAYEIAQDMGVLPDTMEPEYTLEDIKDVGICESWLQAV